MSAKQSGSDAEAAPRLQARLGRVEDCADCNHWTAGTVVVRGATQGRCGMTQLPTAADFGCEHHTQGDTP